MNKFRMAAGFVVILTSITGALSIDKIKVTMPNGMGPVLLILGAVFSVIASQPAGYKLESLILLLSGNSKKMTPVESYWLVKSTSRVVCCAASAGFIFGLIRVFENLSDATATGPGLAKSIAPLIFGSAAYIYCVGLAEQQATLTEKHGLKANNLPTADASELFHMMLPVVSLISLTLGILYILHLPKSAS